jgi:hypothetical protein
MERMRLVREQGYARIPAASQAGVASFRAAVEAGEIPNGRRAAAALGQSGAATAALLAVLDLVAGYHDDAEDERAAGEPGFRVEPDVGL